jgi:hypothetical protein
MSAAASGGNPMSGVMMNTALATKDALKGAAGGLTQPYDDFEKNIKTLLGPTGTHIRTMPMTSVNLDLKEGFGHSTTGIPYAINGTASVISKKVAAGLLGTQDPIHAILKTSVQSNSKVIIKRKYVVGGAATITPERAPARTVAIKEDVTEVELTRYGADIEMNLNLFLRPEDAKEELDMKLGAQKMHLEAKLIELGYEAIMDHGTNIVDGIMRSNPAYRQLGQGTATSVTANVALTADRIYCEQVFGALSKHAYPIPNLLAATRYASAYTIGSLSNAVMILPHGVGDLLKYTRQESMVYNVAGVPAVNGKQVTMELENTFVDPVSKTRILVHHGAPSLDAGSVNPAPKLGGLTDETDVYVYYNVKNTAVGGVKPYDKLERIDYTTGNWVDLEDDKKHVKVTCVMSSAIIASPNGEAGELLVGYPMTGVSTSQATETLRIQLRTYLGCAITNPESVFVLPNVSFEGIKAVTAKADPFALKEGETAKTHDGDFTGRSPVYVHTATGGYVSHHGTVRATKGGKTWILHQNTGHFGCLDSPDGVARMHGARVFSSKPDPSGMGGNC